MVKKIFIYNTLTEKKEFIKKPKGGYLKLFVCGPTVYDYSHLGHARTYLFFDNFVRYLRFLGYKVFYLQNITDIDDKIINRARQEKRNPFELARFFEKEYYRDLKKLKIESVTKFARATDYIKEIIKQVQTLIKKGYAYKIEDEGYYFDISKFKEYGKLAKRTVEQAEDALSRIDESIKKRNKGDFCLWKFVKVPEEEKLEIKKTQNYKLKIFNGEPAWATPLGWGRPGWHIEDTAITESFFGPQYDLHGGALDLKFPHHEAEIAQQEAASGKKPFVKIWIHTGFLTIKGQKMAKSLKNFITIKDFLKENRPQILRWLFLQAHYRSPFDYQEEILNQAKNSFQSLEDFINKLDLVIEKNKKIKNQEFKKLKKKIKIFHQNFHQALADDFNTPKALSFVFDFIKDYQPKIWSFSSKEAKLIKITLMNILEIFGLEIEKQKISQKIKKMAQKRELLRANKQFIQADELRNKIKRLGYEIEDTPLGPYLRKINGGTKS